MSPQQELEALRSEAAKRMPPDRRCRGDLASGTRLEPTHALAVLRRLAPSAAASGVTNRAAPFTEK
jgi:hypothetical protein